MDFARVLAFRLVLAALMVPTGAGMVFALFRRGVFVAGVPGATSPAVYLTFLAGGAVGLAILLGLWLWQRWALWLYGAVTLFVLATRTLGGATPTEVLTIYLGGATILLLAWWNREHFRR